MPTSPISSIMRVSLEGHMTTGNQSQIVNVFHFANALDEPAYFEDLVALYDSFWAGDPAWISEYLDMMPTTYTLDRIRVAQASTADPLVYIGNDNVPGNRVIAGERAPSFVAALLGWRSWAIGGRRGMGRTFIGGLYEADIAGDQLVGGGALDTAIGAFQTASARYFAGSLVSPFRMVILSNPDRVPLYAPTPDGKTVPEAGQVQGTTSTLVLATQRRRKVGRGS